MGRQMLIDGSRVSAAGGEWLETIDPASEQQLDEVPAGGAVDVDRAVAAAERALPAWRRTDPRERAARLRAISAAIRAGRESLARLEVLDNGKPLPEALWDIDDAAGCFAYYAAQAEALADRQEEAIEVPHAAFRSVFRREPVGVVGLIVPWNYPLLMAAWKVAPALAAGCTAVLKPSELTPLTALELGRICTECGLPPGVLNVVTGLGPAAGEALATHPRVRKIAFTGSVATGRRVMRHAADSIRNVTLELGGKSPIIVFDDVATDQAVEWIMFGVFWNQGQVCSATSRLLIQDSAAGRILPPLVEAARRIRVGSGLEPGVQLGPLVSGSQRARVQHYVEQGLGDGARLLTGGRPPREQPRGYFLEPTILADVPLNSAAWREEIFGPVLCVRSFGDEAEALALANDSDYGLAAAVMSADEDRARRVAADLDAGIVWINCSQPTFTEAPWGGRKLSGIGRELGPWGLDNYLDVKQVTAFDRRESWGWYIKPGK